MRRIALRALAIATLVTGPAAERLRAGGAAIPVVPGVEITSPGEHALIAYDGAGQRTVWTVELRASRPTTILYALPLPATAKIERLKRARFDRLIRATDALAPGPRDRRARPQIAEWVPATGLVAVEITSTTELLSWIHRRIVATGADKSYLPRGLRDRLRRAVEVDGARWFLFFHVVVGPETRSVAPIAFDFESVAGLQHPLSLGAVQPGATDVWLTVLSPRRFSRFTGVPIRRIERIADVRLQTTRVRPAWPGLRRTWPATVRLRRWRIRGTLASFERDLRAH